MEPIRENILTSMRQVLGGTAGRGSACLLRGAAGMGKTFLAREFLQQLPDDTAVLVSSVPPTGTPPLMPICQAIASDTRTDIAGEVSSAVVQYETAAPILRETLAPMMKSHGARRRRGSLLSDVAPPETYTFAVLSDVLRRVSTRHRTVLFIDDVQWLDRSSNEFLGFLGGQLASVPIFVLLSARTNGTEPEGLSSLRSALSRTGEQTYVDYYLPPLSASEAVQASKRFLDGDLRCTPGEAEWLQCTSKGIPLYLKEVLSLLRERGDLALSGGAWRFVRPLDSLLLPPSLYAMTMDRLRTVFAALPEAEMIMQYAAVCGSRCDTRLLARIIAPLLERSAESALHRVKAVLERIADATGFVRRVGRSAEFAFDHDVTREAILDDLGELAQDLHRRVADVLAEDPKAHSGIIAYHYRAAKAFLPAAEYFGRAAEEAFRCYAFEEAAVAARREEQMLVQAECPARADERLLSAERIGRCLLGAQRYEEAAEYVSRLRNEGLIEHRPRLLHSLAQAKLNLLDARSHAEAVEILRSTSRQLAGTGDAAAAVQVESELILAHEAMSDRQAAQASYRRAFALAEATGDPAWRIRLRRLSCIFWQPEKVIELTEHALALARKHGLRFQEALCLNNLGTQRLYLHELERARSCFESSRSILSACGGYREDVPVNNLGLIALVKGRLQEALDLFRQALRICLAQDDRLFIRANEAAVLAMLGDINNAIADLIDSVEKADAAGDVFYRDCVRYNLARALLLRGDAADAIAQLSACPPRQWITDDALVIAKRAALLIEAANALGHAPDPEWERQRVVLDNTTKPQAWIYRFQWELCDIQFWQD